MTIIADGKALAEKIYNEIKYEVEIWANRVDHVKICEVCSHHGKCLKGIKQPF